MTYILVKGLANGGLEHMLEVAMSETIGEVENVKNSINQIFPDLSWSSNFSFDNGVSEVVSIGGTPEFILMVESDEQVQMTGMSRAETSEVELITLKLGLVAIDEQSMEIFDGDEEDY